MGLIDGGRHVPDMPFARKFKDKMWNGVNNAMLAALSKKAFDYHATGQVKPFARVFNI